ncbi:MAG: VWA domain-containing protein [Deltaproteobacteria bacterium]|nr:VWA domain-containing protein [Deltaproteobacteria bacterium]
MNRASLAVASLVLCALGCGRSPIVQPCAERVGEVAVLTCDARELCEGPAFFITNQPANALVVLDRSCSMASLVDGRSKWSRAVEAVTQVMSEPRANLRWGLSLFPGGTVSACDQSGPIAVPVASGQEDRITRLLNRALDRDDLYYPGDPCGTNLAGATQQILDQEPFGELGGRHHVVLISDGRHAGCSGSGAAAIDDVHTLVGRDIRTVAVGFGGGEDTQVLQAMGEAGGAPASPEVAYHLAGIDELGDVLQRVVQMLGCQHALQIDGDLEQVRVTFDGTHPVARDRGNGEGWGYADQMLSFSGRACEQLLAGEIESIEIALDCG